MRNPPPRRATTHPPGDGTPPPSETPEALIKAFRAYAAILADAGPIADALADDPDEETVALALRMLELIRDSLRSSGEIRKETIELRNRLMAGVVGAAPQLKMSVVAKAAGCGDSYTSRVAKEAGVEPRTRRRSQRVVRDATETAPAESDP